MYTSLVCPIDLAHASELTKGVAVAADLAKHYGAKFTLIGVTMDAPTTAAHNLDEYGALLDAFAKETAEAHGVDVGSVVVTSVDPAIDLEDKIIDAANALPADLIVMSSHKPGFLDHIFTSHAGAVSTQTDLSVFIVR
jgi:nucleotide-binding universal stress UspA family protein